MTPATRVLLLPGLYDSGPAHWQSHWERDDPSCVRVIQRDWETPARADWVATLETAVETAVKTAVETAVTAAGHDVVLVAHSAACALVAFWSQATSRTVRGALLVAPADTDAPSFPAGPTGWAPMPLPRLPFPSIVVASSDDEYCTLPRARRFADAWGSRFVPIGPAGHINSASNLGPWPQGRALLADLMNL